MVTARKAPTSGRQEAGRRQEAGGRQGGTEGGIGGKVEELKSVG